MVTQYNVYRRQNPERIEIFTAIYLLRFIAVASGGFKTDINLQNLDNIIATLCLLFLR